jgi:hypothetical protein
MNLTVLTYMQCWAQFFQNEQAANFSGFPSSKISGSLILSFFPACKISGPLILSVFLFCKFSGLRQNKIRNIKTAKLTLKN